MNSTHGARRWAISPQGLRGMFNLNDPRWGRGDEKPADDAQNDASRPSPSSSDDRGGRDPKKGGQPPDLDELWSDLNRRLSGLFGRN